MYNSKEQLNLYKKRRQQSAILFYQKQLPQLEVTPLPVVLPYPGLILIIQKDCTYKDSVFCRIFNEKKELLSLYNALFLEQRNENILKYGLVKIPTPACIVLYNGMEKRPEVEILKLSNAFENQEVEPCLELFVKVLNINDGMNENVLNGCKTLKDYVILISKIRENYNEIGDLAKAIHKAVDYCIDADHLRSFLIRNRAEVEPMLLSEGTVEEYVDSMNEVKEQEIERLKRELSRVTQEKNEALSKRDSEIARLKALFASKENN